MSDRKREVPASNGAEVSSSESTSQHGETRTAPERRWEGTSSVLIFATEQEGHPETAAPFLVIPDSAGSFLPQHPGGLAWRYFATTRLDDQMLAAARPAIEAAFRKPGYYISDTPIER